MLKVKNLKVNYGHISALNGISFEVPDNSIVSLIGANGAGKTTTLMAISGLVDAADGQILLDDMDITDCRPNSIVQMGVCHVPEGRHVFPELSVYENLVAGAIPCKKLPRAELQNRIEQQFELFPRLKERSSQMAGTMSGGEQQMLAISRGLMSNPKLLMLDEPSLGLAPIIVEEIFNMIEKVRKAGTTVLLIEQNASIALQISDYAYAIELGRISLSGTGQELLNSEDVKRVYLGM
ncbi:ABC transporter ATP-binding protein [uncultured Gemmiger sp.]|uniref:ABC transporter ATP-binding protein n=1 Tax=uncultured Gemmiger sp. TaxID=1623490 RepID=UPI0027DB6BB9|nr:ABC transporter ATP-binding protein [uncultured Gemmiger sp.]